MHEGSGVYIRTGLVKIVLRSCWDWSRMFVEPGRIGQECWEELLGLVRNVRGTRQDWSRVLAGAVEVGQECSWDKAGLV